MPETLLDHRVTNLERVAASIDESLKTLVRLEEQHAETRKGLERAFVAINSQESRLRGVEVEMPSMKLIRGWVIAGVLGIVGLVGLAVFAVLFK